MSASIDNGPDGSEEDSRQVLSTWLDDYIAGRCDRAKMHESFLEVCRSNPEAPWDALALLDQYQRRGRVDVGLARSLKSEIAQLVFGVANQTEETKESEPTLDTTGSRWRKLYAEKGSLNADLAPPEDPVLRRDLDPPTRPPPLARPSPKPEPFARDPNTEPTKAKAAVGVGTILRDRYELMEVIGSGRSGTLYQAFDRHRSHLPSPSCYVAVRVLQIPKDSRGAALADVERAAYEAQSLSHPNIVSVFDLDRHHDTYFVVMELLDGERLSDVMHRLAGKPMSRERALAVVGAVGSALMHAHQRNIAHGDLKPAVVVLTTNGDVKVLEFGFARSHALDQWGGGEPSVDGADANTTAAYASAERVSGEVPHPRDDVYSLACLAYELLSGRHPYGGRSAPVARAHGRAPQKISALNLRQWHALQNALNWNRDDRRIDVAELIAALGGHDAHQSMPMMPAAPSSLDNPFGRGKGVLLAVLLLVAAGAVAWWQLPRFIDPASIFPVSSSPGPSPATETPVGTSAPAPEPADGAVPQGTDQSAKAAAAAPPVAQAPAKAPPEELTNKTPSKGIVAASADPPPEAVENSAVAGTPAQASPQGQSAAPSAGNERSAAGRTPSIEFDKDTYVATESDGMVRLTVRRNGSTRGTARFRWSVRANSAEPRNDYAGIGPGEEEIPPGARTAIVTIPLVSDSVQENTELFLVELEAVEGAPQLGEQAHAAVILVDDD